MPYSLFMTNLSKINELAGDKPIFALNLLKRFPPLIEKVVSSIQLNSDGKNLKQIYEALHKMKPNLELIGAADIYELSLILENQCKTEVVDLQEFVIQLQNYGKGLELLASEILQIILILEKK